MRGRIASGARAARPAPAYHVQAHARDMADVREMILRGLVEPAGLLQLFERIEDRLCRYPALDPASFRRAVEIVVAGA